MSAPSEDALPPSDAENPGSPASPTGSAEVTGSPPAASSVAAEESGPAEYRVPETSAPEAAPAAASATGEEEAKSAFRVQIGSLGDPEMAREARPKPNAAALGQSSFAAEMAAAGESETEEEKAAAAQEAATAAKRKKYPPPNISRQLSPEMERELEEALGGMSLEDVIAGKSPGGGVGELEPEVRIHGKVISIHKDDLFVELGGQYQGVVSLRQFDVPPELGTIVELVVSRFNPDDGLYELTRPGVAVEVADWSEIQEGSVVQAVITGHNKGGLECKVSKIRGFMPVSHIELFRVEDLEPYVGQSFAAVVTEANQERGNLILSRRGLLEREREETRRKKYEEIAVGQEHEGVVRSLMDFGAFVDLGGIDGLIHISQMSWDRIGHPSEILTMGQKVKVRIEKYDPATGKIGLSYREQAKNPWNSVTANYPIGSRHSGRVTKIMQFGAFVRLEAGVEGLIHISEISYQRVMRVTDVLKEGQEVEVQIVSVDMDNQRIGLSLKALEAKPTMVDKEKQREEEIMDQLEAAGPAIKKKPQGPLKGGTGKASGGDKFGLNW